MFQIPKMLISEWKTIIHKANGNANRSGGSANAMNSLLSFPNDLFAWRNSSSSKDELLSFVFKHPFFITMNRQLQYKINNELCSYRKFSAEYE